MEAEESLGCTYDDRKTNNEKRISGENESDIDKRKGMERERV